jgi:hypothetical protein
MRDEIYRKPLESTGRLHVYVWNEHELVQMQWVYCVEWSNDGPPKIWITSYTCFQRQDPSAQFEEVDAIPFDIPMSEGLLYRLAEHAGKELYSRAVIVGSLKTVPQNFLGRAQEAAKKGYDLKLLREMSQREAAATAPG